MSVFSYSLTLLYHAVTIRFSSYSFSLACSHWRWETKRNQKMKNKHRLCLTSKSSVWFHIFYLHIINTRRLNMYADLLPGWGSACLGPLTGFSEPGSLRWQGSASGPELGSPKSGRWRTTLNRSQSKPQAFLAISALTQEERQMTSVVTHIARFLQIHLVPFLHSLHIIILLLQSSHQLIHLQGLDTNNKLYVGAGWCLIENKCKVSISHSRAYSGAVTGGSDGNERLTGLGVVRLKALQQLLLFHDFILGLVQLDPVQTNADPLPPLLENTEIHLTKALTRVWHLHVCIKFSLQIRLKDKNTDFLTI